MKHYTDSNDYNRIFCHQLNDNMEQIIQALLSDSDKLLELCGTDYEEVTEYQLIFEVPFRPDCCWKMANEDSVQRKTEQ